MTTTPKAKKFRIPGEQPTIRSGPDDAETLFTAHDDGFGPGAFNTATAGAPGAASGGAIGAAATSVASAIAAIRSEGLSARQLRMARRLAQRHGIAAASDFEAVRLLRKHGIDPFKRAGILELVAADADPAADPAGPPQSGQKAGPLVLTQRASRMLPAKTAPRMHLEMPGISQDDRRQLEVRKIQRDIAQRRRRKMLLMFARLAVFVLVPTIATGWYYFKIATPLYETRSEFVIQQADSTAGAGLGSMFSGTQFATSQDSITVQSYLQSRDAMLRLDGDLGFKAHFSQDHIDPIQRLEPDASNEAAYKIYKRNVTIGYDPTEGIIRMEVIAADPEISAAFSRALISYSEERVDQLTQRLREDQMQGARESYADAEAKVLAAQDKVLTMQEQLGVLDPVGETSVVMSQIAAFEGQLQAKRLQLQQLMDNESPNQARVEGTRGDIARLEQLIADIRSNLTQASGGTTSLASVTGRIRIAEAELQTRQLMLSQAAQQMEVARIEANKQVRYLSIGVSPVAPDEATHPRKFENTALAFAIFCAIYLMMSLTASILREQVSA